MKAKRYEEMLAAPTGVEGEVATADVVVTDRGSGGCACEREPRGVHWATARAARDRNRCGGGECQACASHCV